MPALQQVLNGVFQEGLNFEDATTEPRIHAHENSLHFEKGAELNSHSFENIRSVITNHFYPVGSFYFQ